MLYKTKIDVWIASVLSLDKVYLCIDTVWTRPSLQSPKNLGINMLKLHEIYINLIQSGVHLSRMSLSHSRMYVLKLVSVCTQTRECIRNVIYSMNNHDHMYLQWTTIGSSLALHIC